MKHRSVNTLGVLVLIALGFYVAVYLKTVLSGVGGNPHLFFHPDNIANLLGQAALVGILACGMTLVIVSGHIDLSVGSMLGMLGAIAAFLMSPERGPAWTPLVSISTVVFLGFVLGALQGSVIAWIHVPAFVVTLGGLMVYRGVLLIVANRTIPIDSDWVNFLGSGVLSARAVFWIAAVFLIVFFLKMMRERNSMIKGQMAVAPLWQMGLGLLGLGLGIFSITAWLAKSAGLPVRFGVMVLLAFVVHILATRMRFGRYVYAIGGNREAARYSGIRVEWHIVCVFALMGGIAALAGLVLSGIQRAADAGAGDLMELYAIAACVIGGTSLAGGRGTVMGSVLGAMIMATIRNGLSCLGVASSGEKIVLGLILVAAVAFDLAWSGKKNQRNK